MAPANDAAGKPADSPDPGDSISIGDEIGDSLALLSLAAALVAHGAAMGAAEQDQYVQPDTAAGAIRAGRACLE